MHAAASSSVAVGQRVAVSVARIAQGGGGVAQRVVIGSRRPTHTVLRVATLVTQPAAAAASRRWFTVPSALLRRRPTFPVHRQAISGGRVLSVHVRGMCSGSKGSGGGGGGLVATYMRLLEEKPILTKCVTSGLISMAGDIVCQVAFEDRDFSIRRCFNMTLLGAALVGPVLHYWYGFLGATIPGVHTTAVLQRLALDQLLFAPGFVCIFFSAMCLLQGQPEAIMPAIRQNVWPAMIVNWKLWPAANFINFMFVPGQLQVLFANFVALIWNAYLSYATNKDVDAPSAEPVAAVEQSE